MTTVTLTMATADRDGIAAAQQLVGAGNLTLDGVLAGTLDVPRHLSVYCAGDISGVTFTVTGTDRFGNAITEDIVGPDTTPDTTKGTKNFKTVSQVAADGAVGTDVEVGSADEAESQWVPHNMYAGTATIQALLSSGANMTYAVQHTLANIFAAGFQENDATAVVEVNGLLDSETASAMGGVSPDMPVTATRFAVTSWVAGTLTGMIRQRAAA